MATAEVVAFAASDTYGWPLSHPSTKNGPSLETKNFRHRGDHNVTTWVNFKLRLIAETWVHLRSLTLTRRDLRPRASSPKSSHARRLPRPEPDSSPSNLPDPTTTDSVVQRLPLDAHPRGCDVPAAGVLEGRRRRGNTSDGQLLPEPNMDLIDFDSDEGFFQAAGKKKKKQTTTFNWLDDEGDKKDGDGAEEGGDGNKDQNGGAGGGSGGTGGDGGDGGDKKEDKNDEPDNNDDIWDFAPAGNKKKNKKKSPDGTDSFGLPDIPSTDFHEIKLDDGGGGQGDDLDLGLVPKAEKITSGLTAWTSSWTTGSWGWGGLKSPGGSEIPKPAEEEKPKSPETVEENPWGINRGKPKKKTTTTFSFGSFDEGDPKKEDSFDFLGSSQPKEKKDVGAFTWGVPAAKTADDDFWGNLGDKKSTDDKSKEQEKAADAEASDDIWGFSSSKKDKKKKNKIAVVEETPIAEQPPPEAPEPPQTISLADNPVSEAEAALIAEEEAELRKLQTKKDIGGKLNKKQQDRLKVLTENAKAREEAAAAANAPAADTNAEDPPTTGGDDSVELPASDEPAPPADLEAEADEKALVIQEEEDEMYILRSKKKLKKSEKDRLRLLEERADDRAREAEEAAEAKEQEEVVPEVIDVAEAPAEDPPVDTIDAAQTEADEQARIILEEQDELADLRSKKKLKKADKERLRILEERADDRAREAEEAAAAAVAAAADQSVPESNGDATESKTDETVPTSVDDAFGDDSTAQADKDELARLIEEEEFEMEILLSKSKLKKADKARLKELQDNKEQREQEAADKANAGAENEAAVAVDSAPADDAPAGGDSAVVESPPANEDDDLAAKIIEEEEMEIELLLSKSKLKKADKARLKVLQDNKEQREWEAAQKTETAAEAPPGEDQAVVEDPVPEEAIVDKVALEKEKQAALISAEEDELSNLLAKAKLKKAEKARLKELQDRKEQREWEAAQTAETVAEVPLAEDFPVIEETPPAPEEAVDEAALQKEKEDAQIAAEEEELSDLLSKVKLKKAEKARLKELQDRKDKRDEEDRLAAETAEQEARELEEKTKREEEEKAAAELAAEIAADEAEISSLESKKKLKKAEKERLADLKFRRDERASAEAAKLADDLMKEDAENDTGTKEKAQPLSWADDDPADNNGAGDDWMNWGGLTSSSKSKKSKEESVPDPPAVDPEPEKKVEDNIWDAWGTSKKDKKKKSKGSTLIEFGGNDGTPAAPDPPPTVAEASGFDFGWGKPTPKDEPVDDIWDFGSSSKKKKSKNAVAEVVDDTNLASTVVPDPISATKDKGEDDFWSTFGSKKSKDKKSGSSSKDDLVADPPFPPPSPVGMDLTATEEGDVAGNAWGDLSGSTELSKSKLSDKESKKSSSSSKEPKLSKKELEKIEKEKKKAEKEQKAREDQEAKDAAELARLEEEERLEAEAKAEAERLAQEEADRISKEEEEKQAALDAIAKEEADLAVLQSKKDSGKKLLKKEKEKYDKLFASCQARADEKAAQEAAEQAARDEAERLQREAEEQARKEAIEREESELKDLQKKKDSGRKLLKKDKERYEVLSANKKARRQAEKDAEAAKKAEDAIDEPAPAEDANLVDPLEKDLAKLDANELDELDAFLSAPPKAAPTPKATEVDPFSFWGASKKPTSSSKKGKSSATEPVSPCNPREPQHISFPQHQSSASALALAFNSSQSAAAEIAHAESSSYYKLLEATTHVISGGTNGKAIDGLNTAVWSAAWNDTVSSPSQPPVIEQANRKFHHDEPPTPVEPMKTRSSVPKSKIADRLKAFEKVPPPPPPVPADLVPPPPPPPPAAPAEEANSKRKSKKVDIPGSFPDEFEEGHPDDIIEVIEMPIRTKKSSSKKSSKSKSDAVPIPIPPPPPAVPDAPILPPLEVKKEGKKERPKINRDGGSSWGTWTATTPQKDKKTSSKSKSVEEPKKARKERSPEKEDKLSSKGSSSDKAERSGKKEKEMESSRPKLKSVFASTPPISRSTSTREKRHKEGRSSRRPSIDVASGLVSPPPEEMPEVGSKAAKILGIGLGRSGSKRKNSLRPAEDEDIVMVGATDAESPDKSSRRRTSKSYHHDDDIVMVDVADAIPAPGLKRSNTTGSTRKGFGGLFGGILSKQPAELKRRNTYHTDGEDAGATTDADAEARKAARRARRVEKEVAEKSKDELRREKRRKQEEDAEAQRQADKARRAEHRAAREREGDKHKTDEDKDERRRRKRAEREKEREALETGAEDAEAEARRIRRERRKARAVESDRETDAERRRRRAEKRSAREAEVKTPSRRRTEPVEDDFVYPRPTKISRRHTDGLAKSAARGVDPPAWPHSGTSSWVKDHSDAGPPPDDGGVTTEVPEDGEGDEDAARRERKRRRRYGDVEIGGDDERRRKRHEDRSEGSDERRREKKGSMFADGVSGGRTSSGGFGGLWKKLTRN